MPGKEPESRKGGLTLEKLIAYDDVITDALVDKVYFWTTIRKNHGGRFSASRGVHEEDVANLLRQHVVLDKDVNEAMLALVKLPGLKKYMAALKEKDREHFTRHLRRYVSIYMPDCPFEVTTTNRYTITEHEASITARRDIKPREEIKHLTGIQVAMSEEQEKTLELARKDFSLVISSRRKTRSLFLGPARFANHDCDPNARLSTKGYDGMQIVAVKPIEEGQEITVSYGDDYFGDDNEECLCQTCETRQANGWAPFKRLDDSDEEGDEDEDEAVEGVAKVGEIQQIVAKLSEDIQLPVQKRAFDAMDEDASDEQTLAKRVKTSPRSRRASRIVAMQAAVSSGNASALARQLPISSVEALSRSPDVASHEPCRLLGASVDTTSTRSTTPRSSAVAESPKSSHSSDATSVDEDNVGHDTRVALTNFEQGLLQDKPALGVAVVCDETTKTKAPWSALFADETSSEISDLDERHDLDDIKQQIVKRKIPLIPRNTRSSSRLEVHNRPGTPVLEHSAEEGWVPNTRKPGDYMTSRSRLAGKDYKWVDCQTCEEQFVQTDAHRGTRKECPRCERHSKLYGFAWPKTEREGKHDQDERILDHRTIHRFVGAEGEKELRKDKPRRQFRKEIMQRFSTPASGRDGSMSASASVEADSGRRRRRI